MVKVQIDVSERISKLIAIDRVKLNKKNIRDVIVQLLEDHYQGKTI